MLVQSRGDALHFLHLGVEAEEDRRHVDVRDASEPDHLAAALQNSGDQRVELLAVSFAAQRGPGPRSVVERDLARTLERARRRDAHERALLRPARERATHDVVFLRREDERQRRCSVAQVGARDLARLDRLATAVEDVVDDLERDAEVRAELAQVVPAAEQARGLEELRRLQRAALEVRVDGRVGIVALPLLHRLAADEAERRVGQDLDGGDVTRCGELGERTCEEVVAGGAGDSDTVRGPDRRASAPQLGAVDQVVVDERREVKQLDRDAGRERRLARRREEDEQRAQPFASRGERLLADRGDDSRVRLDRPLEPHLELVEVDVEAGSAADFLERGRHRLTPVCSATIPSGPGKRRTLAGRYVYASPPGRILPSTGTTRSNQSE